MQGVNFYFSSLETVEVPLKKSFAIKLSVTGDGGGNVYARIHTLVNTRIHELEEPRWIDFTWKSGIQNFCPRTVNNFCTSPVRRSSA